MSQKELYVPGICNYCDRWCERCPFTSRCRVFAIAGEAFPDAESRNINNDAFWKSLAGVFRQTIRMIRDAAKEQDVDLDAADCEEFHRQVQQRHRQALEHLLVVRGHDYAQMVNRWFKDEWSHFEQEEEELNRQLQMGIEGLDPEAEAIRIRDAIDVIRWYQYQIPVKLARALSGDPEIDQYAASDADGSAKVALMAMDRSIAAWAVLREAFPERGDTILDLLVRLDRLRGSVERTFPNARTFVRPGLDACPS